MWEPGRKQISIAQAEQIFFIKPKSVTASTFVVIGILS
jgi:hypothetical protein